MIRGIICPCLRQIEPVSDRQAEGLAIDTRRNKCATLKLIRKLSKKHGFVPDKLVTDDLRPFWGCSRSVISGSQNAMNMVDGATIEPRIRINRPDDENTRCKVSRAPRQRKNFSPSMLLSSTHSTSNAISPQQECAEPSGHRRCKRGVKSSLWREPDVPEDL